jgi:hypothetical protein
VELEPREAFRPATPSAPSTTYQPRIDLAATAVIEMAAHIRWAAFPTLGETVAGMSGRWTSFPLSFRHHLQSCSHAAMLTLLV